MSQRTIVGRVIVSRAKTDVLCRPIPFFVKANLNLGLAGHLTCHPHEDTKKLHYTERVYCQGNHPIPLSMIELTLGQANRAAISIYHTGKSDHMKLT